MRGSFNCLVTAKEGCKITYHDRFERKNMDAKALVSGKGSNDRISGLLVKLSTDL